MVAVVIVVAAAAVLAVAGDDGGEAAEPTSSTLTSEGTALAPSAVADLPPAPWRGTAVPRADVPPAYVAAWDRAGNRASCALLFPLDGGGGMEGAEATGEKTPGDRGWDIFLTGDAGTVEILALFDQAAGAEKPAGTPRFTRTWADGSVARYGPEAGNAAPGTYDVNSSPFEAVLTLPDQSCAYRIYDTLGRAHLESVFDRLRLMAP